MTPLLVATRSRGKQREFAALLEPCGIRTVFPDDIGIRESPLEAAIECHATFEENARAKARWFAVRSGLATLADDSGLEIDALGGAPGVHSKRFAGIDGPDHLVAAANIQYLLRQLAGVPDRERAARYRTALVLVTSDAAGARGEALSSGTVEGAITTAERGTHGFGYDPVFFVTELGMTFGEASDEAKRSVSHRARAVDALRRSGALR